MLPSSREILDERQRSALEWFESLTPLEQASAMAHACDYATTCGVNMEDIEHYLENQKPEKIGHVSNALLEGFIDAQRRSVA
jgi:hypothetical protein